MLLYIVGLVAKNMVKMSQMSHLLFLVFCFDNAISVNIWNMPVEDVDNLNVVPVQLVE